MTPYETFKAELNSLCERGKITKAVKNMFSHYDDKKGSGMTVYSACSDLLRFFETEPPESEAFASIAERVEKLVLSQSDAVGGMEKSAAVVCAYIRLTAKANATMAPAVFKALMAHRREYEESLQDLKFVFDSV